MSSKFFDFKKFKVLVVSTSSIVGGSASIYWCTNQMNVSMSNNIGFKFLDIFHKSELALDFKNTDTTDLSDDSKTASNVVASNSITAVIDYSNISNIFKTAITQKLEKIQLEQNLKSSGVDITTLRESLTHYEAFIDSHNSLQNNLTAINNHTQTQEDNQQKIKNFQTQQIQLSTQIPSITMQMSNQATTLSTHKTILEQKSFDKQTATKNLDEKILKITQSNAQLTTLKNNIQVLNNNIRHIQFSITKEPRFQNRLLSTQSELQTTQQQVTNLENIMPQLLTQKTHLQNIFIEKQKEFVSAQQQHQQSLENLNDLQKSLEQINSDISTSTTSIKQLQESNATLQDLIVEKKQQNTEIEQQNNLLISKINNSIIPTKN